MCNFRIYLIKLNCFLQTTASRFVYNFNKVVPGIKTQYNVKYKPKGNRFNKLNIHYPTYDNGDISKPVAVYVHGGGWACYSKDCYNTLCKRVADLGYVVFNCNYSLAPKYDMQNMILDVLDAIEFAHNNASKFGGDGSNIVLLGDSAGAHLVSLISGIVTSGVGQTYMSQRRANLLKKIIKANVLFYGAFDLPSAYFSGFMDIKAYMNAIMPFNDPEAPEFFKKISPISYVSPAFPPCLIASGMIDKFHESQSAVMYDVLMKNNVHVEKVFFEETEFRAMHAYMNIDGLKTTEITFNCLEGFLSDVFKK